MEEAPIPGMDNGELGLQKQLGTLRLPGDALKEYVEYDGLDANDQKDAIDAALEKLTVENEAWVMQRLQVGAEARVRSQKDLENLPDYVPRPLALLAWRRDYAAQTLDSLRLAYEARKPRYTDVDVKECFSRWSQTRLGKEGLMSHEEWNNFRAQAALDHEMPWPDLPGCVQEFLTQVVQTDLAISLMHGPLPCDAHNFMALLRSRLVRHWCFTHDLALDRWTSEVDISYFHKEAEMSRLGLETCGKMQRMVSRSHNLELRDVYNTFSFQMLQAECKARGLPVSIQTKDHMKGRLAQCDTAWVEHAAVLDLGPANSRSDIMDVLVRLFGSEGVRTRIMDMVPVDSRRAGGLARFSITREKRDRFVAAMEKEFGKVSCTDRHLATILWKVLFNVWEEQPDESTWAVIPPERRYRVTTNKQHVKEVWMILEKEEIYSEPQHCAGDDLRVLLRAMGLPCGYLRAYLSQRQQLLKGIYDERAELGKACRAVRLTKLPRRHLLGLRQAYDSMSHEKLKKAVQNRRLAVRNKGMFENKNAEARLSCRASREELICALKTNDAALDCMSVETHEWLQSDRDMLKQIAARLCVSQGDRKKSTLVTNLKQCAQAQKDLVASQEKADEACVKIHIVDIPASRDDFLYPERTTTPSLRRMAEYHDVHQGNGKRKALVAGLKQAQEGACKRLKANWQNWSPRRRLRRKTASDYARCLDKMYARCVDKM